MLAAGLIPLAVFGSVVIGAVLLVFVNKKSHTHPYIAVIQCQDQQSEAEAYGLLKAQAERCILKSKTVAPSSIELNYEIRLKSDDTSFVNQLAGLPGVTHAVLVSYNGDYMN